MKPVRPGVPVSPKATAPIRNPIDAFILARLRKENLSLSRSRPVLALVRRVALDLTGLAADGGGSRRVRQGHVAATPTRSSSTGCWRSRRSASTGRGCGSTSPATPTRAGYADDPPRTIWKYRDYVINSVQREQAVRPVHDRAARRRPAAEPDDRATVATAFHRNTMTNSEGGTNDEEFRNVAVVDRVNTTFTVWMGTSMACAQCHTHKYDPITQKEYFQVFAFFNNTADADRPTKARRCRSGPTSYSRTKDEVEKQVVDLEAMLKDKKPTELKPERDTPRGAQEGARRRSSRATTVPIMKELTGGAAPEDASSSSAATSWTSATR